MNADDTRKAIQELLHVASDGQIGPQTLSALTLLSGLPVDAPWPPLADDGEVHAVKATSFADPADVAAFRKCKAEGGTDMHCFSVGDNGIGFTGLDCSEGSGPACALPPEDWMAKWGSSGNAAGRAVSVTANGKSVVCLMKDTLPHKANIKNGSGLDLNSDACAALGLTPPVMTTTTWAWV